MVSLMLGLPSPTEERNHVKAVAQPKLCEVVLSVPLGNCTKIPVNYVFHSKAATHYTAKLPPLRR